MSEDPSIAARRRTVAIAGHTHDLATARAALVDPEPVIRSAGLRALHRSEALTADQLESGLTDPTVEVRRTAVELSAHHPHIPIRGLLDDPDDRVIEFAAWACGERPAEPGCLERLIELVTGHEDALVRESAVAALGALQDRSALPTILTALADKATVRRRAVIALAPFDGPEVDAALRQASEDRDWQVRQAAEDQLA